MPTIATVKQTRSEITRIIRQIVPRLSGHMYCDARKSKHLSNIYGHTIKWAFDTLSPKEIISVNEALKNHNVVVRNVGGMYRDPRKNSYHVQVFRRN